MKFSIPLALLILAIGSTLGWRDHQRAVAVRADRDLLVARAAALGISYDPAHPGAKERLTKRTRADEDGVAREVARDFIAFAKEMESAQKKGGGQEEATQKRIFDLMDRMASLDAGQLKILISQVRAAPDLSDEMRQGIIGFTIMTLAKDHPQAALAVYAESAGDFKDSGMGQHVIGTALSEWAKTDPLAASDWIKKNAAKFPELPVDYVKRKIIAGAATEDPALAFRLMGELGLGKSADAISDIVRTAKTPEERTAMLAALRSHVATLDKERAESHTASAMQAFGVELGSAGYESATAWLDSTDLAPGELANVTTILSSNVRGDDIGKWVGWMGGKLPAKEAAEPIRRMITNWTQNDYQAAGKWLAAEPAGPTRDASVRGYAETVAAYEPETAAQWAMTLPAGKQREETLANIYRNWPTKDDESRAAAKAFAKEHGLK